MPEGLPGGEAQAGPGAGTLQKSFLLVASISSSPAWNTCPLPWRPRLVRCMHMLVMHQHAEAGLPGGVPRAGLTENGASQLGLGEAVEGLPPGPRASLRGAGRKRGRAGGGLTFRSCSIP